MSKVGKPNVTGVDVTPFVVIPQPVKEYFNKAGATTGATNTQIVTWNSTLFKDTLSSILNYEQSSTLGDSFTALKRCKVSVGFYSSTVSISNGGYEVRLLKNDITGASNDTLDFSGGTIATGAGPEIDAVRLGGTYQLEAGEILRFYVSSAAVFNLSGTCRISLEAEATSDQILTAPETFSTDTAPLTYAGSGTYTLATLDDAPVGTFITYTYTASSNTRVQTVAAPTQTTSSMNTNGILLTPRAYNATGAAATPATFLIQIGKGLLGFTPTAFISLDKVTPFETNLYGAVAGTAEYGVITNYDPITGILTLDSGANFSASTTVRYCGLTLITNASNAAGYMTVTASKNPALTGLGLGTVAARGVNTAGTSIVNGATGILTYDTVKTYDTNVALNASTGVFTAPETGYYEASFRAALISGGGFGVGEQFSIYLYKNAVLYASGQAIIATAANTQSIACIGSTGVYLIKGETLDVRTFQDSGANITLSTSAAANYFSVHKTNVGN
jgi:hypothetical protein